MIKDMQDQEFNTQEVAIFEKQYLAMFKEIANITRVKKQLEEQESKIKKQLEKAMDAHDIKAIDNEFMKITRVAGSTSTSIDLKALLEKEPDLHKELLKDYPKVTERKGYLTFKVKDGGK